MEVIGWIMICWIGGVLGGAALGVAAREWMHWSPDRIEGRWRRYRQADDERIEGLVELQDQSLQAFERIRK